MRTWSVERLLEDAIAYAARAGAAIAESLWPSADFNQRATRAAAAHDVVEGLNEYEAENDGIDPPGTRTVHLRSDDPFFYRNEDGSLQPKELTDEGGGTWTIAATPSPQCKWCGDRDVPGHDCGRKYHEVLSSAASASAGDGSAEGEPPTPSPSAEHPTSDERAVIAEELRWHFPAAKGFNRDGTQHIHCLSRTGGHCPSGLPVDDWASWREHAAACIASALLADRLKANRLESGEDMGARVEATAAVFPQHQK